MKNKMRDLRDHLFAALEGLADADKPMEIERAKAIAEVSKVLIDSAKVQVEVMKLTGAVTDPSGFIEGTVVGADRPARIGAVK